MEKLIVGFIGLAGVAVAGLLGFMIVTFFTGFHYETSRGEHTGYITAVERTGIFFKTKTVYLKTDTQSSQEDRYCVTDEAIYSQLQEMSQRKAHINAFYFGWFSNGIATCAGAHEIIYKIQEIN